MYLSNYLYNIFYFHTATLDFLRITKKIDRLYGYDILPKLHI